MSFVAILVALSFGMSGHLSLLNSESGHSRKWTELSAYQSRKRLELRTLFLLLEGVRVSPNCFEALLKTRLGTNSLK